MSYDNTLSVGRYLKDNDYFKGMGIFGWFIPTYYIFLHNYDIHAIPTFPELCRYDVVRWKSIAGQTTFKVVLQVESKTNNKIKDLLSSDSLSDDTRLVLVNALYFKVRNHKHSHYVYTLLK